MTWKKLAACAGMGTGMFFLDGDKRRGIAARREKTEKARAVCRHCPVTPECLDFAIRTRSAGIWGGLTEKERDAYAKGLI
jgi:WhiB family transcriptional regulator, redox-sensing transcriptional regulator